MSSNSSLLCQQSCLAPLVLEAIVLTHQLPPSKHDLSLFLSQKQSETLTQSENKKHCPPTDDKNGGWNLLQSLTNTSSYDNSKQTTNESQQVYVHPLTKSSYWMSTRSLEMCTETLGSETGTHIMDELTYLAILEKQSSCRNNQPKPCKKTRHVTSFPPPLTTIGGNGGGVEMRARREEGRLVIEAVVSSSKSCFKAERENGRRRLSLVKDDCNLGIVEEEEEEVEVVVNKGREDGRRVGRRIGGGGGGRCSGDGSGGRKNLPSLPFWVAIS